MITKNGKAYDSSDVVITLLGNVPNEVYNLNYSVEQEHQLNYALGSNEPSSWSMGKVNYTEGSIELALKDTAAIEAAARKLGLTSILKIPPFDIIASFVNEFDQLITDRITCKFMSDGRNLGGDMALRYSHKLFVIGVNLNKGISL